MGKKDKKSKKGKGAEKTAAKTEKKQAAKMKKEIAASGEDDIEKIVAQIEQEERKRNQVIEKKVEAPDRRINFSFAAHPEKDELFLFGGEFFNGQKTVVYNDLYVYNIQRNDWTLVKAPGGCPPRCGHQMVALPIGKGQLWVFGGEFTSPSESQFYHYRDLWVYHLGEKKWEKINATGGPSARSGHRMVVSKRQLIVFGGFHDNLRSYKYFNDVYIFDLETYQWREVKPSGNPPAPRSACQMVALPDGKVLIWGGYSKESKKKDVDKGIIHNTMFLLSPEKHDTTGTKWKWQQVKQGGVTISPRTGAAAIAAPGNRAYSFGGVYDEEQTEEDIEGTFFNDLFLLDCEKYSWRTVSLSGKRPPAAEKRRRRKEKEDGMDDETEETEQEMEVDPPAVETVADDGVFKVTVGPSSSVGGSGQGSSDTAETLQKIVPSPRMNCGLAIKHGVLYLFGGMREMGDRQLTLRDMFALDLHKLEEWKVILNDDEDQEWIDSSDDDDEEDEDDEEDDEDEEEDDEEASDNESEDDKMV